MEATHSRLLLGAFFLTSISTLGKIVMKPGCIASLESINKSIGLATVLSPSEVASVCPGEQLELTCSTNLDYTYSEMSLVVQPIPNSRESFI